MWLGIVIAVIFFAAGVVVALAGIYRIVRRDNWPVGVTMLVPALIYLYFLGWFAGPGLLVELFGDPSVSEISADAQLVEGDELLALFEGQVHAGKFYDDTSNAWLHYKENYLASGGIRGKMGPENNPEQWSYSGVWKFEDGKICTRYDGDYECSDVYATGDTYSYLDEDNQVTSWFVPSAPSAELDPTATRLLDEQLRLAIDGMAHAGKLADTDSAANFQMVFFSNNHAVYTKRGDSPDQLGDVEYGWYRFDDNRVCLTGTLGLYHDCFAVYVKEGTFSFVREGVQVDLTTNPVF
ncbi:MAG: hypothetical protein AAF563_04310 [Pseudomonadota bacterium]